MMVRSGCALKHRFGVEVKVVAAYPGPIITHRYKMADFDEAIRVRASTDARVGKVILTP